MTGCLYDRASFWGQAFTCGEWGRELTGDDFVYFPFFAPDRTLCGSCVNAEVATA